MTKPVLRWTGLRTCLFLVCLLPVYGTSSESSKVQERERRQTLSPGVTTSSVWGAWGAWSECSRTCGGGIAEQTRPCLRRRVGTRYFSVGKHWNCVGLFQQYKSCNTQPCPTTSNDFRQMQCEEHNDKPFMGKVYEWEPFLKAPNPCALNCRAKGYRFYAKLADTVTDGTPCEPGSSDVCVNGQCKQVGCDGILGSNTKLDRCGICGGDNSQCNVISDTFDQSSMSVGYNMIVKIPEGATKINVTEMARSRNYLAVKGPNNKGYINSDWSIDSPGDYQVASTVFEYKRPLEPASTSGEQLLADGPLSEAVDIMLIYQQQNPGVHYEYIMMTDEKNEPPQQPNTGNGEPETGYPNGYVREDYPRTNPGLTSGNIPANSRTNTRRNNDRQSGRNGNQGRKQGRNNGRRIFTGPSYPTYGRGTSNVGNQYPSNPNTGTSSRLQPPYGTQYNPRGQHQSQPQNPQPGYSGGRNIGLQPPYGSGTPQGQPRPGYSGGGVLNTGPVQPGVRPGLPSGGQQGAPYPGVPNPQRPPYPGGVSPQGSLPGGVNPQGSYPAGAGLPSPGIIPGRTGSNGRGYPNPYPNPYPPQGPTRLSGDQGNPGFGGGARPSGGFPPQFYEWRETGMTECSKTCAGGTKRNVITCVTSNTFIVVTDNNCDSNYKPRLVRIPCNTEPCPARWESGAWSACSRSCGDGVQMRQVNCMQELSQSLDTIVAAQKCGRQPQPEKRQSCKLTECPEWKVTDWGRCSVPCGAGSHTRTVTCEDGNGVVENSLCSNLVQPAESEGCDMGSCAKKWFYSDWSDLCSEQCGQGVQTRNIYCAGAGEGGAVSQTECTLSDKPKEDRPCRSGECSAQWFASTWSQCSAECGPGTQTRTVICIVNRGANHQVVAAGNCATAEKPSHRQECTLKDCEPQWLKTHWSECSKTCDGGHRTREVKCLDDRGRVSTDCDPTKQPEERQSCNILPCPTRVPDGNCKDRFGNCNIVVQARLCKYPYYKKACCFSCYGR
ncbi:thrombospondin type-1 domain-containing protein 4-like isoform X2 [Glandiceps talaboti]